MLGRVAVSILAFAALLIVVNFIAQAIVLHPRNSDKAWANGLAYDLGLT